MAITDHIRKPTFIIKIVELVISIVIAGLASGQITAINPDVYERRAVVDGTIVTFIILNVLIIIGYILDCPIAAKLILISSATACVLFAATGGIILDAYYGFIFKFDQVIAAGILSLINAVVYAADAFLTWKYS